jgi:hypothetical protein
MSDTMTSVCEHGHQARKCEVCELKAELKRLRNICENASACVSKVAFHGHTSTDHHFKLIRVSNTLAEEGKKP